MEEVRMEDGRGRMGDGRGRMEDGKGRMGDGRGRMMTDIQVVSFRPQRRIYIVQRSLHFAALQSR